MMLPIESVEIPTTVAIRCPIVSFKNRLVVKCLDCDFFNGVAKMSDNGDWHDKYVVRCSHIIERRVINIEVVE